jgi:hypothetical protein
MSLKDLVRIETVTGQPVRAGELSLKPEARVLRLQFPWGGFVWNRPVAVVVDDGRRIERMAIVDVTRAAQVGLLAIAGIFTLLTWRAGQGK